MVATDGSLRLRSKKEEGETMGAGVAWHQKDRERENPQTDDGSWDTKGGREKPASRMKMVHKM